MTQPQDGRDTGDTTAQEAAGRGQAEPGRVRIHGRDLRRAPACHDRSRNRRRADEGARLACVHVAKAVRRQTTLPGALADGIQIDGGYSDILIQNNTIDMSEHTQTAAVMIDNYFGPTHNVTVTGNRLLGGGYTVYADGQFRADTLTGITYSNNRIKKGYWGYFTSNNAQVTWTGNTDDTTGKAI